MKSATWGTLCYRYVLALAFCLATSATLCAQSWSRAVSFGGTGMDVGVDVKIDAAGNRYLTGYFSNSVTFGVRTLTSRGSTDIFLAKYGFWVVQIGGTGADQSTDIALDSESNIYLTGWFTDSATFGTTSGSPVTVSGASGYVIFLAKYNSSGVLQWVQTGATSSYTLNQGIGVAVDTTSGAVYVTGVAQDTTSFSSSTGGPYSVPGPGTWHIFLVKYDTNGNFQWGEWNSASANSISDKVAVGPDGSVYAAGWFEGTATFYSEDGNNQTVVGLSEPIQTPPDYPGDGFVLKYDSNGNLKWVNDIGGYKCNMEDIVVSSGGLVSATGEIGNIDGNAQQQETLVLSQPPGTTINLGGGIYTTPYNQDIIVATYDENGVTQYAVRIGGAENEAGTAILSSGSDLYVSSWRDDTDNLYILKLTAGVIDWSNDNGGPIDGAFPLYPRITLAPNGAVVAIGSFLNTATFGSFTLTSAGSDDVFLSTLAP